MSEAHAVLSASGSPRWLNCPGSIALSEGLQSRSSSYASEGHAAHELGEVCIKNGLAPDHAKGGTITTENGSEFPVDDDMVGAVEVYVRHCRNLIGNIGTKGWGAEKQVTLDKLTYKYALSTKAWGTTDFWALQRRLLHVVDYKHGKGIPVDPVWNTQLMYYGLGLLLELKNQPVQDVALTVVQPRVTAPYQPPKTWMIPAADLLAWGISELVPGMRRALTPGAKLQAGSWCRFCPAKARCPELRRISEQTARIEFSTVPPVPRDLTDEELGAVLDKAEIMGHWLSACRGEASSRSEKGRDIPNWKLVPKRGVRKWTDPEAVRRTLKTYGYDVFTDGLVEEPKLKSPKQVQAKVSPAHWAAIARDLVSKESSGSTLVPDNDPREQVAVVPAGSEFGRVS